MFKWSHSDIIVIPVTTLILILIAIALHFLLKNKSSRVRKIPLQILALLVLGLEIAKIIYFSVTYSYHNNYYALPLHFCSLFMVIMPLSQFFGERVGKVFRPMAFVYAFMVTLLVLVNPYALIGNSTAGIFLNFHNAHTFFFHFSVIGYFIISIALGDYIPAYKDCINVSLGIIIYASYAIPCAYALNVNYVNILESGFQPLEDFRLWAGQAPYNILLLILGISVACITCVASCLIYSVINKLRKNKQTNT